MDIPNMSTVVFGDAVSSLVCAVVMAVLWVQNRRRLAGLAHWLAGFVMQLAAVLLVALRGTVPDLVSMTGSGAMIVGGTVVLYGGLERFLGRRGPQLQNVILIGAFTAAHAYFVLVEPHLRVRNILLSLGLLAICGQCAWLLLGRVGREVRSLARGVGVVFLLFCLFSLLRIAIDATRPLPSDLFRSGLFDTLGVLTCSMLFIALAFSLVLMVNRRLVSDLSRDLAERERAGEALRESEERLRRLIDNILNGTVYQLDWGASGSSRTFTYLSAGVERLHGITPAEGMRDVSALYGQVLEEDRPMLAQREAECVATMSDFQAEFRIRHPSGQIRWVLTHSSPRRLANNHLVWDGIEVDITEGKRAAEALRESEEKLKVEKEFAEGLLEAASDTVFVFEPATGRAIRWNDVFRRVTGYSDEEIASLKAPDAYYGADDLERAELLTARILSEGRGVLEMSLITKDGRSIPYEYSASVVSDRDGSPRLFIVIGRDMTERKQREEALQLSEEKFFKAFHASPDAILISRLSDGVIVDVNEGFCRLSGFEREACLSHTTESLGVWEDLADRRQVIAGLRAKGTVRDRETSFRSRSGRRVIGLYSGEILQLGGEAHGLSIVRDVTELRRVEALVRLRLELWEFATAHPLGELLQKALDAIGELTESPIGFYHLVDENQDALRLQAWSTRTRAEFCAAEGEGLHHPISRAGVWVDAFHQRRPVVHNDYAALPHRKGMPEGHAKVTRELVVPVLRSGRVVSILGVGNKASDYDEADVGLVSQVAEVTWTIVEQKLADEKILQLNGELTRLAMTDELTGLANRRAFFEWGAQEVRRAKRFKGTFSLLVVDLDAFKPVNDTHGHEAGDCVLRCVVNRLKAQVREVDLLARLGGDEFGIVLGNVGAKEAAVLGERLRQAVESELCDCGQASVAQTVSVGVAAYAPEVMGIEGLLRLADQALYRAKSLGRNRVVCD